jgi:alpha-tubulin suppressor-like RCC1 family protein
VEGLSDIVSIQSGGSFVLALDKNGNLFSWGQNRYGQLGLVELNAMRLNRPHQVSLPGSAKIASFSCGEDHSALVTERGQVFTWGYG